MVRLSRPVDGWSLVPNYQGRPGFTPVADYLPTYTSLNAGANVNTIGGFNPAALWTELDIVQTGFHHPGKGSVVVIHGVSLAELSASADLTRMNCAIYGGMSKGLPLANPAQSGLLASGQVLQATGNWVGGDMSLTLYVAAGGSSSDSAQTTATPASSATVPSPSTNSKPSNLIFNWAKGQTLISALTNCLSTAYPQYAIQGQINTNLVNAAEPISGFYATLEQLAKDVWEKSLSIISGYAPDGAYPGVTLTLRGNVFFVDDGSASRVPKEVLITDIVGQPTWVGPTRCQLTTIMRGDLAVGDVLQLPAFAYETSPNKPWVSPGGAAAGFGGAYAMQKANPSFSGYFKVLHVRHVGDNRSADSTAWVSTFDLVSSAKPTTASTSSTGSSSATGASRLYQTAGGGLPVLYTPAKSAYQFFLPG